MKKFLLWTAAIIAIVILAITFLFDPILELAIEKLGSKMTGTTVSLGNIDLSPFSGKCELQEFHIGNPEGFQEENAIKCGLIKVKLSPKSIFSDKIVINEIYIDSPEVYYETSKSGNNIEAITNNIKEFAAKEDEDKEVEQKEETEDKEEAKEGKKLQVDLFVIKNPKITIKTAFTGKNPKTISIPDIELKDIGSGGKGISKAKVVEQISAAFAGNIVKSATKVITEIPSALGETMKSTEEKVKDSFSKIFGGSDSDDDDDEEEE